MQGHSDSIKKTVKPPFTSGENFYKHYGRKQQQERTFVIDYDKCQLSWTPKKSRSSFIPFEALREIRLGKETPRFKQKCDTGEDHCFSIIYGAYKSMDLIAKTPEIRTLWVVELEALVMQTKESDPLNKFLIQAWVQADKNRDEKLDFDEILKLLHSLNVNISSKSTLKKSFQEIAQEKRYLNFEDFKKFYWSLKSRPEIKALFNQYLKRKADSFGKEEVLGLQEFNTFLKNEQGINISEEEVIELINKYEIGHFSPKHTLSFEGFSNYLLGEDCLIWNPEHLKRHQDMNHPLSHYWINSSHNTYLLGDQLKGKSSCEAYIRAFQSGCKCVELDCWDGPDGPIIYHGHTLTTKILFKDVVETIAKYAFCVSEYPIILSLEVHCGISQQDQMADILIEVLGDALLKEPIKKKKEAGEFLPSPEELKNKILLKGHGTKNSDNNEESEDSSSGDEGEEPVKTKEKEKSRSPKGKVSHSQKLANLVVYCKNTRFRNFETSKTTALCDNMSSFSEGRSEKFSLEQRKAFIEYNRFQLSRIYPAGSRVDSSNYPPGLHWAAGCQIVAFNFQTLDRSMQLNTGKFLFNGNCGYILKPEWMIQENLPRPAPKSLTITIISAQQLPKPNQALKGEIIDPYVGIDICGDKEDEIKIKTKYIDDNGFNPRWDELFRFRITNPDVALIRFTVYDKDMNMDDFIGSATIPFNSIRTGCRHIQLRDSANTLLELSTLFVKIKIDDS